ncbi:MAG TPA: LysR substrate-binding domain-containing protein [Steroidobacteraceae bacterium]|nr:LysR substrate-binding domain-containing protein [Steroidobacteraceae bacterium]
MARSIGRRWLPLNALRAFEGVAKHGSFTAAASSLLISQSALSRHVIALESLLGCQLFERRPHALVLTKAGHYLLVAIGKSFDRLEHALDSVRNEATPATRVLRVRMPPSFAVRLAVPLLREFRQTNSEVEIDLVSPAAVDAPLADADVAVTYSTPMVTDLVTDLLWLERPNILCHPDVAARGADQSLAEFIRSNELVHVRIGSLPRHHVWSEFARQAGLAAVEVERGIVFDTAVLAVEYILSGEGLALLDPTLFTEELKTGRLVSPFDLTLANGYGYYLVTHPEDLSDTAIAMFRSWLIERFGRRPAAEGPRVRLAVSNE